MLKHIPIGYRLVDGKIEVDEEKAKVIREIFDDYLKGSSMRKIAEDLEERGFLNKNKEANWYHGSIGRILEDSKYLGDESYSQIIDEETFLAIRKRRDKRNKQYTRGKEDINERNQSVFIGKISCGECGDYYRKYRTDIGSPEEEIVWRCHNHTYQRKMKCKNLVLDERELEDRFIESVNYLLSRMWILDRNKKEKPSRFNFKIRNLEEKIKEIEDQEMYSSKELVSLIFERAKLNYSLTKVDDYEYMTDKIKTNLDNRGKLQNFDGELFKNIIKKMTVYENGHVEVQLINGLTLEDENK